MRNIGLLIGLLSMLFMASCDSDIMKKNRGNAVAQCYGKYLYESDLNGVVPEGTGKLDSITRVNAFIDSWIRRELLIHQAERNLSSEQRNFTDQLTDYRNSLTTYAYETQLINQKLDTVVDESEIQSYYDQNKDNFQLRANMVKVAYVVLKEDSEYKKEFEELLSDSDTLLIQSFDNLARQHAISHYSEVDNWVPLDDLLRVIPIDIYNVESFFDKNRFVSFDDEQNTYMIRFEDYLLSESVSPIEIEHDNIKNIILMKRKKHLLNQMNMDLYEKAVKENAFDIY
jgi:hypothetical protein